MSLERSPGTSLSVLNTVAMQVVAAGIEPSLGALDVTADPADHPPEPRRMIHFDEMCHLMAGEIIQHIGRRQDQPPRERQGPCRGARTPAARLIADRQPLHPDAQRLGVSLRRLLQIAARFALEVIVDPPLDMLGRLRRRRGSAPRCRAFPSTPCRGCRRDARSGAERRAAAPRCPEERVLPSASGRGARRSSRRDVARNPWRRRECRGAAWSGSLRGRSDEYARCSAARGDAGAA